MQPGDVVEDFELPDETGTPRRLSTLLRDGPVVLFFYPAAMTSGCTAQACRFRDLAAEFAAVGAQAVGISPDTVERQRQFATTHGFAFPLLADADGTVARRFGTRRSLGPLKTRRRTFVIAQDGTLLEEIRSEFRMEIHADRALEVLGAR